MLMVVTLIVNASTAAKRLTSIARPWLVDDSDNDDDDNDINDDDDDADDNDINDDDDEMIQVCQLTRCC